MADVAAPPQDGDFYFDVRPTISDPTLLRDSPPGDSPATVRVPIRQAPPTAPVAQAPVQQAPLPADPSWLGLNGVLVIVVILLLVFAIGAWFFSSSEAKQGPPRPPTNAAGYLEKTGPGPRAILNDRRKAQAAKAAAARAAAAKAAAAKAAAAKAADANVPPRTAGGVGFAPNAQVQTYDPSQAASELRDANVDTSRVSVQIEEVAKTQAGGASNAAVDTADTAGTAMDVAGTAAGAVDTADTVGTAGAAVDSVASTAGTAGAAVDSVASTADTADAAVDSVASTAGATVDSVASTAGATVDTVAGFDAGRDAETFFSRIADTQITFDADNTQD